MTRKRIPPFSTGPAAKSYPDWLREEGAKQLAGRIVEVWRKAGHMDVQAWVERAHVIRGNVKPTESTVFAVKTNLVDGLPPSMRG